MSNARTSPTTGGLERVGYCPTSVSFGNVTTDTSSATQNVTITNTGDSNVAISQISVGGPGYSVTGGSTPVTLAPSQNLVLGVQFSPAGSISIISSAAGSPAMVTLSGTGVVCADPA